MARTSSRPYVELGRVRYFLRPDGYYRSSRSLGGVLYHRAVWEAAHGPLPDDWHVHHVDHDKSNNALSNLRAIPADEHRRHHAGPRGASGWDTQKRSAARVAEWQRREPRDLLCAECGTPFRSTGQRAQFCGQACGARASRRRRKNPPA